MDSRKYRKLLRCFFYPAAVLFMAGALFCGCTAGGGTTAEEGGAKKESPAEESPTESTAPEAPEIKPVTEPEENGPGGNWYPDIIWNGFSPDTGENGPSGGSPREGLSDSRSGSVLQPGDAADEREAAIPRTGAIPEAHTVTVFQEDGSFELVVPEPLKPSERVIWDSCRIDKGQVLLRGHAEGSFTPSNTVMGRDTRFYVVELAPYEDSVEGHDCIASLPKNAKDLSFPLRLSR